MNSKSACRSIATARPSRRGLKARKKLRGRTSLTSHGNRLPRGLRGQHSLRGRKGFDTHHAMQFIQGQDWLGLNNYIEDALLQAGFGRVNAARMSTSWVGDWSGAQWPASSFIGQLQQVSDIIGRGPESYRPGMGLYSGGKGLWGRKWLGRRSSKAKRRERNKPYELHGEWWIIGDDNKRRPYRPGGQEVAGDEAPQGDAQPAAGSTATSADTGRHQQAMRLKTELEKLTPREGGTNRGYAAFLAANALSAAGVLHSQEDVDDISRHIARKLKLRYDDAERALQNAGDPGPYRRNWMAAQIIAQQLADDPSQLQNVLEQARLSRLTTTQLAGQGRAIHPDYAMEVGPLPPRKRGIWERVRRATVGPSCAHIMDEIAHDLSQMTGHLSYGVPVDELEVRPGVLAGGHVHRRHGRVRRSDTSYWDDEYITIRVNPKYDRDVAAYLNSKFSSVTHPIGSRPGEFEVRVDNYTGKSLRRRKGLARRKAHARSIVTTRPKKCCKSLGGLPILARNLNRVASKGWAITDNAGLQVYTKSGWQPRALVQHKSLDNAYLFRTQRDAEAFCALHTLNGFADRI